MQFDSLIRQTLDTLSDGQVLVITPAGDGEWRLCYLRYGESLLAECVGWSNVTRMRAIGWQSPAGSHSRHVMWINASGTWQNGTSDRQPLTPATAAQLAFTTLRDVFAQRSPRAVVFKVA